jgi:hypothetical protein
MPACKQQEGEITPIVKQEDTITLQDAQHWYTEQLSHQTAVNSKARTTKHIKREPLWKFAQNMYLANGVFVISVPLQYEKGYGLGKGG